MHRCCVRTLRGGATFIGVARSWRGDMAVTTTTTILLLLLIGCMTSFVDGTCKEPSTNDLYNEALNVNGLPSGSWQGDQRYNNCLAYDAQQALRSLAVTVVLKTVNGQMQFPVRVQAACVGSTVEYNVTTNQTALRNETSYCGDCLPFPTNPSDPFVAPCVRKSQGGGLGGGIRWASLFSLPQLVTTNAPAPATARRRRTVSLVETTRTTACAFRSAAQTSVPPRTARACAPTLGLDPNAKVRRKKIRIIIILIYSFLEVCTLSCFNGGSSQAPLNCYSCSCPSGYTGRLCETNVDECVSQPCLNDGTCVDGIDSYTCNCTAGFTGNLCETDIDDCANTPTPCRNGGTCRDDINSYYCDCPSGYHGQRCTHEINECESNPCRNGGTCNEGFNGYNCTCTTDYYGIHCENRHDDCAGVVCSNGGTCVDGVRQYSCACLVGFTGRHCETNVDECASTPCANGGTCTDSIASYACSCLSEYTGMHCETELRPCESNPCLNNGTCASSGADFVCACPSQFTGASCETNLLSCEANAFRCRNGSTCREDVNRRYECTCAPGYEGLHCETEIKECASSPCLNDAQCVDEIDGYYCVCRSGYTGQLCETDVDECASFPCHVRAAACIDEVDGYRCTCPPGFAPPDCALGVCDANACSPVGSSACFCLNDTQSCRCRRGYGGDLCETKLSACDDSPCFNGGTCTDLSDGGYTCNCTDDFTGRDCEIDKNVRGCDVPRCFSAGYVIIEFDYDYFIFGS